MPRVLIVRGHQATPWELAPWTQLPDRFEVRYLQTGSNDYDTGGVGLEATTARALRDVLPSGRLGDIAARLVGDRYIGGEEAWSWADIVHGEELSYWFAAEAAKHKAGNRYRLVQTVWETIPFLHTYRNRNARRYRDAVLAATDLFLPATERAADGLRIEGVPQSRILVCAPGIDVERFATDGPAEPPRTHTILSAGRLVYEKGHQDVMRALATLRRGLVGEAREDLRLRIIGSGPERDRLAAYAADLGVGDLVGFGSASYDEMPGVYADASCLVLASLPSATGGYHPFDIPRVFWEEQFGLVLAEAMAAGLDIIASRSGAIPDVVGETGTFFPPGDYMALARALRDGPLSRPAAARVAHPPERVALYSTGAMAERLAAAYDRCLAPTGSAHG